MGSAGFLVEAQEYLREHEADLFLNTELREHFNNDMFYGFDMGSDNAENRRYEHAAPWSR